MNPYTGQIATLKAMQELSAKQQDGFRELPGNLNAAASKVLGGRKVATVSLKSGGKLSKWAAAERRRDKERSHNRIARQSRKRNRA